MAATKSFKSLKFDLVDRPSPPAEAPTRAQPSRAARSSVVKGLSAEELDDDELDDFLKDPSVHDDESSASSGTESEPDRPPPKTRSARTPRAASPARPSQRTKPKPKTAKTGKDIFDEDPTDPRHEATSRTGMYVVMPSQQPEVNFDAEDATDLAPPAFESETTEARRLRTQAKLAVWSRLERAMLHIVESAQHHGMSELAAFVQACYALPSAAATRNHHLASVSSSAAAAPAYPRPRLSSPVPPDAAAVAITQQLPVALAFLGTSLGDHTLLCQRLFLHLLSQPSAKAANCQQQGAAESKSGARSSKAGHSHSHSHSGASSADGDSKAGRKGRTAASAELEPLVVALSPADCPKLDSALKWLAHQFTSCYAAGTNMRQLGEAVEASRGGSGSSGGRSNADTNAMRTGGSSSSSSSANGSATAAMESDSSAASAAALAQLSAAMPGRVMLGSAQQQGKQGDGRTKDVRQRTRDVSHALDHKVSKKRSNKPGAGLTKAVRTNPLKALRQWYARWVKADMKQLGLAVPTTASTAAAAATGGAIGATTTGKPKKGKGAAAAAAAEATASANGHSSSASTAAAAASSADAHTAGKAKPSKKGQGKSKKQARGSASEAGASNGSAMDTEADRASNSAKPRKTGRPKGGKSRSKAGKEEEEAAATTNGSNSASNSNSSSSSKAGKEEKTASAAAANGDAMDESPASAAAAAAAVVAELRPTRKLVVIIEDVESFQPQVLSDLLYLLTRQATGAAADRQPGFVTEAAELMRLPFVVVLAVATHSRSTLLSLSPSVSSRLWVRKFHLQPSQRALETITSEVLLNLTKDPQAFPLVLSAEAVRFVHEHFESHSRSLHTLIRALRYIVFDHFGTQGMSHLCLADPDADLKLGEAELSCLASLPSVKDALSTRESKADKALRDDEVQQWLSEFHSYRRCFLPCFDLLEEVVRSFAPEPWERSPVARRRELYLDVIEGYVHETPKLKDVFSKLRNLAPSELASLLEKLKQRLRQGGYGESSEQAKLVGDFQGQLNHLIDDLKEAAAAANDDSESTAVSKPSAGAKSLHRRRQQALTATAMESVAKTEPARTAVSEWFSTLCRLHLRPLSALPLSELFFTSNVQYKKLERMFVAEPRATIHQALTDPAHWLAPSESQDGEAEAGTEAEGKAEAPKTRKGKGKNKKAAKKTASQSETMQEDICIAFRVYEEAGRVINLFDWFRAFCIAVSNGGEVPRLPKPKKTHKKKKDKEKKDGQLLQEGEEGKEGKDAAVESGSAAAAAGGGEQTPGEGKEEKQSSNNTTSGDTNPKGARGRKRKAEATEGDTAATSNSSSSSAEPAKKKPRTGAANGQNKADGGAAAVAAEENTAEGAPSEGKRSRGRPKRKHGEEGDQQERKTAGEAEDGGDSARPRKRTKTGTAASGSASGSASSSSSSVGKSAAAAGEDTKAEKEEVDELDLALVLGAEPTEEELQQLQARFVRATDALRHLGFIKPSGRKVDHVTKLSFFNPKS